jgi:hypothetical protein
MKNNANKDMDTGIIYIFTVFSELHPSNFNISSEQTPFTPWSSGL